MLHLPLVPTFALSSRVVSPTHDERGDARSPTVFFPSPLDDEQFVRIRVIAQIASCRQIQTTRAAFPTLLPLLSQLWSLCPSSLRTHARPRAPPPPPFELDVIHAPLTYWPQAGDAHNYTDAPAALLRWCRLRTAECTSRCGTARCGLSAALIVSSHFIDINSSPFSVPQTINRTPFTTTTVYSRATPPRRYSSLSSPNNNKAGTNRSHDQQYQPQAAFPCSEDCISDTDGSTKAEAHFAVVAADASVAARTDQSAQCRLCGVRAWGLRYGLQGLAWACRGRLYCTRHA